MFTRIALLLSAAFWLTMNYLLWRSEFGGPNHPGSQVPVEVVWRKILTSPDNSSLDVLHDGKKVGYAQWAVSEWSEPAAGRNIVAGPPASGQAGAASGYRLTLEGSVVPDTDVERIHLDLNVLLSADRSWQELNLRVNQRENALAIRARAAERIVHLRTERDGEKLERVLTFDELQNPRALADLFALPVPVEMFDIPGLPARAQGGVSPAPGPAWAASSERINLGHTSAHAYRLETRLLDRWQIVILVSPVGEILRVELPDGWVLATDETGGF
jgi:hypothetical protein